MLVYLKKLTSLSVKIIISFAMSCCLIFPAMAMTQEIEFDMANGYRVIAIFSYDEAKNPALIQEHGHGETEIIDSMKVNFYQPSGELIARYDNIVDGIVTGNYFEFNFDPKTQKLLGNLDIGGESAGEVYLKGKANEQLSVMEITELGAEKEIATVSQLEKQLR